MRAEPLAIGHRDLLQGRLKALGVPLSEYTFANLYLFREAHAYEVLSDGDLFVRGTTYDGSRFLLPLTRPDRLDPARLRDLMAGGDMLFPIPDEWLSFFPAGHFSASWRDGDADYLYTVGKMSTYAGRRLHKKRNLLKQFLESHRAEARPLTNDRIDDARFVLEAWQRDTGLAASETDYAPCREALDRYEELALCGGMYYADGEPAGFVLGEETNEETYVLHFAKARTKFKGVYQYLFNNFAQVLPPKYKYLNLEQDLDKENLRVFKTSYVPDAMLRKARISLRR